MSTNFPTLILAVVLPYVVAAALFALCVFIVDRRRFLPHARNRGSLSILGGSGYQRGVEVAENGINCESFECRYFPEVNEGLQGIGGETFVKAKSTKYSRDITVQGETAGSTGVMAYSLVTGCTVANDVATYGDGSGTILFDEATETQNRTAWRSVSAKLSSNPLLTLA